MFYIWDSLSGEAVKLEDDYTECFYSEEEAQEYIKGLSAPRRKFCEIKPYCDEVWAAMAREALLDGAVSAPVWDSELWYQERFEDILTFATVDPEDIGLISYFASRNDGKRGKRTSTTPGRYLKKFFADKLSEDDIKYWSEKHKETFDTSKNKILRWASTPEEIQEVYSLASSFYSCMQHNVSKWGDRLGHPTRAYGAGDLKVAYITNNGKLIARALVWPEKKLVGRVYGNDTLLRSELKKAGIVTRSNSDTYDCMVGARLLYIPIPRIDGPQPEHPDIFVPYIDGTANMVNLHEDGYLRIVDCSKDSSLGQYNATSELGLQQSRTRCSCCNNRWLPNSYRDSIVFADIGVQEEDLNDSFDGMCNDCRGKIAFYCEASGAWYKNDKFTKIMVNDAYSLVSVCLEVSNHKVFKSALSGNYFYSHCEITTMFGKKFGPNDLLTHGDQIVYFTDHCEFAFIDELVKFANGNINWSATKRKHEVTSTNG